MVGYDLIEENNGNGNRYSWWRIIALIIVYLATTGLVFISWNSVYDDSPLYPDIGSEVPNWWYQRALFYANHIQAHEDISHDIRIVRNQTSRLKTQQHVFATTTLAPIIRTPPTTVYPLKVQKKRLVCYYSWPATDEELHLLYVDANLCTHIHIGPANVRNSTLSLPVDLSLVLQNEIPVLRSRNSQLKFLLWVGGAESGSNGFPQMVENHTTRKLFLRSLKRVLREYHLDGVDLDWEFPTAYNKERQHLSQLLSEIKEEYQREQLNYLLSVAVAAPEGIAVFAYDISELNKYVDYVNVMTYDFHFYTHDTPFTGINAPLYARSNEHSILSTLNINYSVNWWLANGLQRDKLVVGIPTYGHSFTLVNPFNNAIGSPSEEVGRLGDKGFTTYEELCWFVAHNLVSIAYDQRSCSPYLSSGTEWISYENVQSIEIKVQYAKAQNLGGVMLYSLNTDDFKGICQDKNYRHPVFNSNTSFPLVRAARNVLFSANKNN